MRTNLATDPRVVRVAARLKMTRTAVVGAFWALWCAASEHGEGGIIPDADASTIDAMTETLGFADAAVAVKWLAFDDQGAICPRIDEHSYGDSAKTRAKERDKKRRQRQESRKCPPSVPKCPRDKTGTGRGHVRDMDDYIDIDIDIDNSSTGGFFSNEVLATDETKPKAAAIAAKVSSVAKTLTLELAKAHSVPLAWSVELRDAFGKFLETRYAASRRCTAHGIDLLIAKVQSIPQDKRLAAVNQSIANGYQGIFPTKDDTNDNGTRQARRGKDRTGEYTEPAITGISGAPRILRPAVDGVDRRNHGGGGVSDASPQHPG